MSFCKWITTNYEKIDAMGDPLYAFANDVLEDMEWPNGDELEIFIKHIMHTWKWGTANEIDQMRRAWDLYQWDSLEKEEKPTAPPQDKPYVPGTAWDWSSAPGFDKNKNRKRR